MTSRFCDFLVVMRGEHPNCNAKPLEERCKFCRKKADNIAKKNSTKTEPTAEPASVQSKNVSGDVSDESSGPTSTPVDMAAKIAAMNAEKAGKNAPVSKARENVPAKPAQPVSTTQQPTQPATQKKKGWFEQLFSGWGTLLDD